MNKKNTLLLFSVPVLPVGGSTRKEAGKDCLCGQ